jgi:hypothetical protein
LISARVFRISLALDYLFVLPQVYLSAPNPNAPLEQSPFDSTVGEC